MQVFDLLKMMQCKNKKNSLKLLEFVSVWVFFRAKSFTLQRTFFGFSFQSVFICLILPPLPLTGK